MNTQLLIPAAGTGARLGLEGPKALAVLAGKPLLFHTLHCFETLDLLAHAVIVVPPEARAAFEGVLREAFPDTPFHLVDGGPERQVSVANGLERLRGDTEIVVIHDAARPFVPPEAIRESIGAARRVGAATAAIPCSDTILEAGPDRFLSATPDRASLWTCQTPQAFRVDVIRAAHRAAQDGHLLATDDASLVREAGGKVKLIEGSPLNLKITTPADLAFAEYRIRHNGVPGEEP